MTDKRTGSFFYHNDVKAWWDEIDALKAENAALRGERDAARDAVNRLGRAMGVVPGVAQCFGDVIDEAIKRLSALTPAPVSVGMLEQAYLLGFNVSCVGWNGECPYQDDKASPTTDAKWIEMRDAALRALADKGGNFPKDQTDQNLMDFLDSAMVDKFMDEKGGW